MKLHMIPPLELEEELSSDQMEVAPKAKDREKTEEIPVPKFGPHLDIDSPYRFQINYLVILYCD